MRTRNLYDPASRDPYRLSRSKIELFLGCPRCFYLDRRLGIGRPEGPPFTLNAAVDLLLKKEFDLHRLRGEPHPLMTLYGVEALPWRDPRLEAWRDVKRGVEVLHGPTNFLFFGAVDDVWADPAGNLLVVDYKATSSMSEVSLEGEWKRAYKRQMEMYQWLVRGNGLPVLDRGYFVYVNADRSRDAFDGKLEFSSRLLPYDGDDGWVEEVLAAARECLCGDLPPPYAEACEWCQYRREAMGAGA
jgi:hypothetical protein